MKWGSPRVLELQGLSEFGGGKIGIAERTDVCGASPLRTSPLLSPGHYRRSVAEPGTTRASGAEAGPGPQEGAGAATAPPVGLSAPPTWREAEPARSRGRRRWWRRRSEPSPGSLRDRAPGGSGGAARRQTSEPPAEDSGGESAARGDPGAARDAALGVGRPVWGPPPSSRGWEARWREGTEKGRKGRRVSRRAGTGRGSRRRSRGWGREGRGRRDPAPTALVLRRAAAVECGNPGALRGYGRGNGPRDGAGAGVKVSLLTRFLALPGPCAPRSVWAGRLRRPQPRLCGGAGFRRRAGLGGRPRATPLFPTFFRSFLGLARGRAARESARRGGSGGEVAGQGEEDPELTSRGAPRAGVTCRPYLQVIGVWGSQDSGMNLA